MTLPRIFWCWPEAIQQDPQLLPTLQAIGEVQVSDTLPASSSPVQILVPRLTQTLGTQIMAGFPDLRMIATPSTGTDHIDTKEAQRRSIEVVSLRHDVDFLETVQSTAELAWLLILNCVRRFREANRTAMTGAWNAGAVRGNELIGKTIGIIGLGRLGTMVARFALAFRMRVLACDIRTIQMEGVIQVEMDELLRESDIVSIHVHLDDSTRGLIGRREIGLMKPGAVLVNTARGAIIDEAALLEALADRRLSAAGLDVLNGERDADFVSHPLIRYARDHDHLILTPHVGGCTIEAQSKAFMHIAQKIGEVWRRIS